MMKLQLNLLKLFSPRSTSGNNASFNIWLMKKCCEKADMLVKENEVGSHGVSSNSKIDALIQAMQEPVVQPISKRKLKLVGAFIISAFFILLSVKIFLLLFVIDPVVGTYGFISTLLVSIAFFFSFTRYKDPSLKIPSQKFSPHVTVIVPSKNDGAFIKDVVEAALKSTYQNIRMILVNDGSTDNTGEIMSKLEKQYPERVKAIDLPHNMGKRKAILTAIKNEKEIGDIIILIDSDTIIGKTAIEKVVGCFTDSEVGAVTAHGRALNRDQNILTNIQDTWYYGSFLVMKGMERSF